MFEITLIVFWSVLLVWWVPRWLRGSILGIDTARGGWWPFWLYEQFLLVLPAPTLLAVFGVAAFPSTLFVVRDPQVFSISVAVLYAVTFFFLTVAFCIRMVPKSWLDIQSNDSVIINSKHVQRFASLSVSVGFGITVIGILFLNYHNALIDTLTTGKGLIAVRLDNKYNTGLPSQVQFVITVAAWIGALHAGYSFAFRRRGAAMVFLAAGVILAGGGGGKAPIVFEFLLAGTAYLVAAQKRLSTAVVVKGLLLGSPVLLLLLYFVVSLQLPGLSLAGFLSYLVDRIGMAQMAGTYDGIALGRLQGEFYWHMVPFANFFEHYVPYDKMLMMRVEGYDFANVGVKNSFFISEAFGIGGYTMLLASPFIVGATWALSTILTHSAMKWMFGSQVARLYFLPLSIMYLNVTGGFSPFPLLKSFILMLMVFGLFWIPHFLMSLLPRRSAGMHSLASPLRERK